MGNIYKRYPLSGAGGDVTITAERDVGSITEGMTLTNASLQEFAEALLLQEKNPTLVAPSSTFVSTVTGFREVGQVVTIQFTSTFNRGQINPAYGTSGFRSGLPNEHVLTGTGLVSVTTTDLSNIQTVTDYVVLINGNNWTGRVAYDEGEQPLTSYGNPFESPLPAGNTTNVTRTITGVYPYFATTVDLSTDTKQALQAHGSVITLSFPAESGFLKQQILIPTVWGNISKVEQFNTLSGQWDVIANTFTNITPEDVDVQGNLIAYNRIVNTSATIGNRQVRFTF